MPAAYTQLKERLAELSDLEKTSALLRWDQHVNMPPGGAAVRAEQLGTLDRLAHDALVSDEVGRLLDELASYEASQPYDSDEASLIRTARREWEKQRRVPGELAGEISRSNSLALPLWAEAREKSDFSIFLPALRRNFELRRRLVECFDGVDRFDEPYDVLLDEFEPGMKTAEVRTVFARLKEAQIELAAAARRDGERPARGRAFPLERQKEFELEVIGRFGFDPAEWRLDPALHPFAMPIAPSDIRLT